MSRPSRNERESRRRFLQQVATASAAAASASLFGCTRPHDAVAPIAAIDTHTHFYDPTRPGGVPWPPKQEALLYRRVMPSDFRILAKPAGVVGTVVVEASPLEEDNQWILNLADKDPFILGLVGHLKPGRPNFRRHLDRFSLHPRFRGIRIGGWEIPIEPDRVDYLNDLKQIADRNLAVDTLGGPDQLPTVAKLATALPSLRIVINHIANVRIDGGRPPASWVGGMRSCASHPNVYCKVSALVEGTGRDHQDAPTDLEFYRPVLDAIWEIFGEDRLIYGSNWPVSERFASHASVHSLVAKYVAEKGGSVPDKFFRRNAKRAYRLA